MQGKYEGSGGPAQSFEEAMERIREILKRKGLTIPEVEIALHRHQKVHHGPI